MKIFVITDAHANLPALAAALDVMRSEGYDAIFHTGDAIAIGPQPAECVDLLSNTPKCHCLLGNHETYLLNGLPTPQPSWLSDGEVRHQLWTHAQLGPHLRSMLAEWPYYLSYELEGVRTTFVHYGITPSGRDFQAVIRDPSVPDLDRVFEEFDTDLLFFGHDHSSSDVGGRARYVNPGSLGCYHQALARYCAVEFHDGQYQVEHRSVPYDDAPLFHAFEQLKVPERDFIYRVFLGGRFKTMS